MNAVKVEPKVEKKEIEIQKNLTQSHEAVIDVAESNSHNLSSLASDLEDSIEPDIKVKNQKHTKKAKVLKKQKEIEAVSEKKT